MFPKDALDFFKGVSRLGELARKHGEIGPDGNPVWQIVHWQAFCKGARAYAHLHMFGMAIVNTVQEVEACIADEYDALSIHNILLGIEFEREVKNLQRDPRQIHYVELGS